MGGGMQWWVQGVKQGIGAEGSAAVWYQERAGGGCRSVAGGSVAAKQPKGSLLCLPPFPQAMCPPPQSPFLEPLFPCVPRLVVIAGHAPLVAGHRCSGADPSAHLCTTRLMLGLAADHLSLPMTSCLEQDT